MTRAADEEVLYEEQGAGIAPLLWGPGFAVVGFLVDLYATSRPHTVSWLVVAVVLLLSAAVWVYARRRFVSVRVTASRLSQGDETLSLVDEPLSREHAVAVCDEDAPVGTRVLGGGFTPPRKCAEVTLRLDDGTRVLAWARDGQRLRSALRQAIET